MSFFQHPQCYARSLGDCLPGKSEEHYVTEGLLRLIEERFGKESQVVEGVNLRLPHLKPGVSKKLTIGRLEEPILCPSHNSRLNTFDTASIALFKAMDAFNESSSGNSLLAATAHRLDGDAIERWMLKTLCGGLYSGRFPLPDGVSCSGVCPPTVWLNLLYNGAKFPDGLGFYYVFHPNGQITADRHVAKFKVLLSQDGEIVKGLRFWLFGFEFLLLMHHLVVGDPAELDGAARRPAGIRESSTGSNVEFTWADGPGTEEINVTSLIADRA
jgi:hypothetical protein